MRNRFYRVGVMGLSLLAGTLMHPAITSGEGRHVGEADKLAIHVEFLDPLGYTTTDRRGIHYHVWGMVFSESKFYPESTYGARYPLYFMGMPMRFRVTLANTAEKGAKPFKVRVNAVNYVMETTGYAGRMIAPGQNWIIDDLRPGQTRVVEGSIFIPNDPTLPSGLDVTKVRVFHLNNGENDAAGFIKEATATWCPPKNIR